MRRSTPTTTPRTRASHTHKAVKHSVSEYVNEQAHTNGIESFWATLKRGYRGTCHHMSEKRLTRYVAEFKGRHNSRPNDTAEQTAGIVRGMDGKRLRYQDLVAWREGRFTGFTNALMTSSNVASMQG